MQNLIPNSKGNKYIARLSDEILNRKLKTTGAVLIEGPKWCGKTTTATHIANSVLKMDDLDNKNQYIQLADLEPRVLLEGAVPRLIDEWQIAPNLWNEVRNEVDNRAEFGQFILTGSAVPKKWMKALILEQIDLHE